MKRKLSLTLVLMLSLLLVIMNGCKNSEDADAENPDDAYVSDTVSVDEIGNDETDAAPADENTDEDTQQTAQESEDETDAPEKTDFDTSFFDDAVFIGDSVTMGLKNYVTSERNEGRDCLGEAQFLTAGSMGYTNSLLDIGETNSIHPTFQGQEVTIQDGVSQMNVKKAFIMLGMNDFCIYKTEQGVENAQTNIKRITEKNPGIKIYIQSVTPTMKDSGSFNNANIDDFNEGLKDMCKKNGWTFVDVASVMKDSYGALQSEYCSDPDDRCVHMSYAGCEAWVNYLYNSFC